MKLRIIKNVTSLKGKRVLVRVDFNVPMAKNGSVADDWKIRAALPTIEYLIKKGARTVLSTHLGRPTKPSIKFRLDTVSRQLARLMVHPFRTLNDCVGPAVSSAARQMKDGDVLLLQNLRFHPGEESNDPKFSMQLASLADIFVQDGFAVCHRPAASVVGIARLLPSYAGLLVEREVRMLGRILEKPKRPFVALLGGAKLETKLGLLERLLKIADAVLVGGALANELLQKRQKNIRLMLPVDVVVLNRRNQVFRRAVKDVKRGEVINDIGPETVRRFAAVLRGARTIVWNGPLGLYEDRIFSHGTMALARFIAARGRGKTFAVAGGGETVDALRRTGMIEYVDWVSTGGGAMLEFLEGKMLPGIKPLIL